MSIYARPREPFKEAKLWWSFDMFTHSTGGNDDGLIIKTSTALVQHRKIATLHVVAGRMIAKKCKYFAF